MLHDIRNAIPLNVNMRDTGVTTRIQSTLHERRLQRKVVQGMKKQKQRLPIRGVTK
jgi:hypothetical protein